MSYSFIILIFLFISFYYWSRWFKRNNHSQFFLCALLLPLAWCIMPVTSCIKWATGSGFSFTRFSLAFLLLCKISCMSGSSQMAKRGISHEILQRCDFRILDWEGELCWVLSLGFLSLLVSFLLFSSLN